jgi:hypothetical protein
MTIMARHEQRRYTLLERQTREAMLRWNTTQPATMAVSADELQTLISLSGIELFKDYPAETRRRMARSGAALPDGSFPIADCKDASDAIRSIGRAAPGKRDRARAHIRKRVRSLGCSGPIYENWK